MVRILLLTHKFRGEDKKRSLARNRRLSLGVQTCFCSGTKFHSGLGGIGPEMHSSGTGPVTFLRGTILAWRGTILAWGTSSDVGGHGPEMPPQAAGPASSQTTSLKMSIKLMLKKLYSISIKSKLEY